MSRPRALLLVLLCSAWAPPALGQLSGTLDMGAGRYRPDHSIPGGIASIVPALRYQSGPFEVTALGAYSDAPGDAARAKLALVQTEHNVGTWKTPSLRNVALTPPYMHEGQLATLADVVEFYSTLKGAHAGMKGGERLIQPLNLSSEEKRDLVRFLESLTDVALAPELMAAPPTPCLADGE